MAALQWGLEERVPSTSYTAVQGYLYHSPTHRDQFMMDVSADVCEEGSRIPVHPDPHLPGEDGGRHIPNRAGPILL